MSFISWKPHKELTASLTQQTYQLVDICFHDDVDNKIMALEKAFTTFVPLLENTPLEKVFIHWLGSKNVRKDGHLNPELIARYLITTVHVDQSKFWVSNVQNLQKTMNKIVRKFLRTPSQDVPRHFQGTDIQFLDKRFWKSYHILFSTLVIIDQLQYSKSENIQGVIKELEVWCLHFLVSAAKVPIFNLPNDSNHYPFGEYQLDNEPHYHREDGGAIVQIFIQEIKKKYEYLKDIEINLIKNNEFRKHIINCCRLFENSSIKYKKIGNTDLNELDINNLQIEFKNLPTVFLDFSLFLQSQLDTTNFDSNKNFIVDLFDFIHNLSINLDAKIIFGGVANINNQDFYFFQSTDPTLLKKFTKEFKIIQGSHGAYPEIMLLKRYLIEFNYNLKSLLKRYPICERKCYENYLKIHPLFSPKITLNDVENEYKDLINQLDQIKSASQNSDVLNHCIGFIHSLLSATPCSLVVNDPKIYEILFFRMRKIKNSIKDLQKCSFQKCLSKFHLTFDYIQYLFIFFKIDKTETLNQLLNNSSPKVNEHVDKQSFTFTSGIACYGNIADELTRIFSPGYQPKVCFEETSYYELTKSNGSVRKCMEGRFHCRVNSLIDFETIKDLAEQDIIFTDLYPNRVVFESVKKIEVEKMIKFILDQRSKNSTKKYPLVVVIDCATTFFMHQEFQNLLDNLSESIEKGDVIGLLTNSFVKYTMGGCDKFSGGSVQVFGSKKTGNTKNFCQHLTAKNKNDPFSEEAERCFYLLLKYAPSNILNYLEMIKKNTNIVYSLLDKKKLIIDQHHSWMEPIHVGFKDREIPMIGLHFNYMNNQLFESKANEDTLHTIVEIMQYYLFAKFVEKNLPITMKQSFGFASSNLIECWSAVRLTIGLETDMLHLYPEVIDEINKDLQILLSCKKSNLAEKIQELTNTKLVKNLYLNHLVVLENATKGFEAFLEFLSSTTLKKITD